MTRFAGTTDRVLMSEAVTAAKLGQKPLARKLLRDIVERDPRNEQAWLWVAALSVTAEEAHRALVAVLDINPHNQQAMNALAMARLMEQTGGPHAAPAQAKAAVPPADANAPLSEPRPAPEWHCPLCRGSSNQEEVKCPRCGAILSLAHLDELAENRGVSEDLLLEAIQRQLEAVAKQPSYEAHLFLAYAYLNLNRSAEAVPHLKKAAALQPGLATLARALHRLQSRQLILTVDDSLTVRKLVSITLERHGYRVLTAADGMQALARLNEEVPDLILLDITMPRMDGYQVCKVIKQNPYTKHIPVIMLSGKDGFFNKVKGRLAGATDYLTKPFPVDTLPRSVARYLGRKNSAEAGA